MNHSMVFARGLLAAVIFPVLAEGAYGQGVFRPRPLTSLSPALGQRFLPAPFANDLSAGAVVYRDGSVELREGHPLLTYGASSKIGEYWQQHRHLAVRQQFKVSSQWLELLTGRVQPFVPKRLRVSEASLRRHCERFADVGLRLLSDQCGFISFKVMAMLREMVRPR